ncbi:hypothetical protein DM02DRAFT_252221 [Periconia macrospinosa]|uniref:Uncharacterized protein n=1 Tax=Periconia macrospinosa TaxID=97972 RepID=A0A2V1D718_9PLEO|nr:hypothetical protein DM02DRAFT_252221 [Periconia macrospinosa]
MRQHEPFTVASLEPQQPIRLSLHYTHPMTEVPRRGNRTICLCIWLPFVFVWWYGEWLLRLSRLQAHRLGLNDCTGKRWLFIRRRKELADSTLSLYSLYLRYSCSHDN